MMLICNPRFARLADQRFGSVLFSALEKYQDLGAHILLPDVTRPFDVEEKWSSSLRTTGAKFSLRSNCLPIE
jgi:hypothetical protein